MAGETVALGTLRTRSLWQASASAMAAGDVRMAPAESLMALRGWCWLRPVRWFTRRKTCWRWRRSCAFVSSCAAASWKAAKSAAAERRHSDLRRWYSALAAWRRTSASADGCASYSVRAALASMRASALAAERSTVREVMKCLRGHRVREGRAALAAARKLEMNDAHSCSESPSTLGRWGVQCSYARAMAAA